MLGKLRIPHCLGPPSCNGFLVHRSKVGSIVAGCIGTHLARGKVKSVEHVLSWSLDSKQLPLPIPFIIKYLLHAQATLYCPLKDLIHVQVIVLFKMFSRWFFANKKIIIMLRTSKFGDVT